MMTKFVIYYIGPPQMCKWIIVRKWLDRLLSGGGEREREREMEEGGEDACVGFGLQTRVVVAAV